MPDEETHSDPECPEVHPFTLMLDPAAYVAWQQSVGADEAERQTEVAITEAMSKYGVRVVLSIGERMDNLVSRLEEFHE